MSVLVVSIDDLAAFAFMKQLYGGTVHTPNIDRLMAMGTTFENGFSQVALCNPSRTSMMTGLSPAHTGVHQNAMSYWDAIQPEDLLMSRFQDAGYHTSMIGKVMHSARVPDSFGAQFADYIFEDREGVGGNRIGVLDESLRDANGDEVNVAQALQLLQSFSSVDQFAMFVGINKPHLNWVVPQEFYDMYPIEDIVMTDFPIDDLMDLPGAALALTGQDRWSIDPADAGPEAMQAYLAAISYADNLLGQLLDELDASGLTESTTIVLWTDHGYHLGDKDAWGKFTLWEDAARAPFIIAQPGTGDDGQIVSQVVELVDIMPTLMELEGLTVPQGLDGRSLVSFIENPALLDDGVAITSMNGNISIRTNEWRYTRYTNGEIELYSANDPHNFDNLAIDPAYADIVAQMNALLYSEAAADGWIIGTGTGELFGTDASESFVPFQEDTIHGGGGNDLYHLLSDSPGIYADVVELADGGYDTIRTNARIYTIPDNVERLIGLDTLAEITGNDLDNVIYGGQSMWGGAGNDVLYGRNGDDYMVGGTGDDLLSGGTGWDTADYSDADSAIYMRWRKVTSTTDGVDTLQSVEKIIGTRFDDTMYGTNKADEFHGGDGADMLYGEDGDDLLFGEDGFDTMSGGIGSDKLDGGAGKDVLSGGDGNDQLFGGDGWDEIDGGSGDDLIDGGVGNDTATYSGAAAGVDVRLLKAGTAHDTIGAGIDTLVGIENLNGSEFADFLSGDDADNTLTGNGGNDTMKGLGGRDILRGGNGFDDLFGGDGDDVLRGGDGNDLLIGGNGWDVLFGDNGDDFMSGANGNDQLYGGAGVDKLEGGLGNDKMFGQSGIDLLYGGDGDDIMRGGNGNDLLFGEADNDTVDGGAGDDTLDGGAGNDIMIGSWGIDRMTGGAGADTFVFEKGHSTRNVEFADHILDFSSADGDLIDLSAIDAIEGNTGDDAFAFIGAEAFTGTAGELRAQFDGTNTVVEADMDGDGVADFTLVVDGDIALTGADFIL